MAKSKTVLITGAGVRLGQEMALSLADAGWDVAIHYHTSAKQAQGVAGLVEKKGQRAHLVQADLSDAKAVAGIIPSLTQKGVTLDCLINNASVFEKDGLAALEPELWDKTQRVNLLAPLLLTRDFAAQYKGSEGNVINITDGMFGWSISPTFLSYSLSKLALDDATCMLARELAPNIRVNAVAPGATLVNNDDAPAFEKLRHIIPLGRTSSPEEVVRAIHFILSSPSLTGQVISLSGGMGPG